MLHLGGLLREGAFYLLVDLNTFRKRCMQKFPSLASARQRGAGVCLFLKHFPKDGNGKNNPDYRSVLDNDRD